MTLPQFRSEGAELIEGAVRAVSAGFDSLWLFDHLWPLGAKERPIFECWSSLAYLAAAIDEVAVGTLVTRSTLRNRAVLAAMATTVAAIAPGRLVIGVGSGDATSAPENLAFGIPYLSGERRRAQLTGVIETLAGKRDENGGGAFQIWVGGTSKAALDIAARHADGYNCWGVKAEIVAERASRLAALAHRNIEVTWGGQVVVGRTAAAARARLGARDPSRYLVGDTASVTRELRALAAAGADHLIVASPFAADPETYELLGEVAAEVRV